MPDDRTKVSDGSRLHLAMPIDRITEHHFQPPLPWIGIYGKPCASFMTLDVPTLGKQLIIFMDADGGTARVERQESQMFKAARAYNSSINKIVYLPKV